MRLIDADALLEHQVEADKMGAMLVVGIGHIFSAPTVSPWVKTSDRLPTEADANIESLVLGWRADRGYCDVNYAFIVTYPRYFTWWMPLPPLPEVEE